MAKITTRAGLVVGTELIINEPNRTFQFVVAGNMVAKDGGAVQALYSKFVDLWATATYQDSPFPMNAIDALSGQYQIGIDAGGNANGWRPLDIATRQMMRDGGWEEYDAAGTLLRVYVNIAGLGVVSAGSQLYYQAAPADAPTNFTFLDQANEAIQVFGNATNGNFDKRAYFKGYVREQGQRYTDSVLADTGKTSTGANIVNLLLSNEADLKISANDAAMTAAPYAAITVTYFALNQNRTIGGTAYPFRIIVAGNGATLEQIYTKLQYLLRQATDIDAGAGTVIGKTANVLAGFIGSTLRTANGVFIDAIQPADANRIEFTDQNGVIRTNPFVSAGVLSFNPVMVGAGAVYRLMFTAPPGIGNNYGEAGAITVVDSLAAAITGSIATGTITFDFDYDGDTLGGLAGTDKAVTLIGVMPGSSKFAVATGVLTRSKAISLSLVAETDRAYV